MNTALSYTDQQVLKVNIWDDLFFIQHTEKGLKAIPIVLLTFCLLYCLANGRQICLVHDIRR